jgi:TonB family protein
MCSTRRPNLTLIAAAFVFGTLSGRVAVAQTTYIALKTTVDHVPEPVDGIVTVTLASGAWIKLRVIDVDHDRTAAYTDRIIIRAATATEMTASAGRKYVNLTFGLFVATAWVEDVDWDEMRVGFPTWSMREDVFGRPASLPTIRASKSEFERVGRDALAAAQFERALDIAQQCLDQHRNHKPCEELAASARQQGAQKYLVRLNNTPPGDLRTQESLLRQLSIFSSDPVIVKRADAAHADITRVGAEANRLVAALKSRRDVPDEFPKDLEPFVPFFPELQKAKCAWDPQCALRLASQLKQENKTTDAIGLLSPSQERPEIKAESTPLVAQPSVGDFGPSFQFESKGVDFRSWLRRFRAQVYSNWMIPYAAMTLHGHTVQRFTVHKDGTITGVEILQPSAVDVFTKAAFNALSASNPTVPLPQEYPDEKMVMTVVFYYNENPPGGGAEKPLPANPMAAGLDLSVTDVSGFCCPEYLETLKRLVYSNWQQRQGQDGTSVVRFVVHRDGSISDVTVEQGTNPDLNLASQRAVTQTDRLPPLPTAYVNETLTIHLTFQYKQ